jgi:ABC-2 type transport system permease protein
MKTFKTLTWTELKLFLRDPLATVFALAFPITMMLLLAAVFGDSPPDDEVNGELVFRGATGDVYYLSASLGLVAAAIGLLVLPVNLTTYRDRGVLRRLRSSGLRTEALFAAHLVVGTIVAIVGGLIMVAGGRVVHGSSMPEDVTGVAVAFALAILSFTAVGFLLAAVIPTARAAQGIGLILFFTVWMISGTAPPLAVLPDTLRQIAAFEPLTHVVIAVQDPWFGNGWNVERLAILGAVSIVAGGIALWKFDWS